MLTFLRKEPDQQEIIEGLQSGGTQRRLQEKKLYEVFFYFIKQGTHKYRINEEDAASAYSDTIISVINNIVTGKFEGRSTLKSYTYQIFMNKCVDLVRKDTTNKNTVHHATSMDSLKTELSDSTRSVIQDIIIKNEKLYLKEKLKELGDKCRQILLLYEDGYSDKQIASELDYNSADVVKTSRLRCIEKLKEKVMGRNPKL
jgi:RNA polymerase sigma factor (sigma-70 family)